MEITVIKMSYFVNGNFVSLTVKSDSNEYSLWLEGSPVDVFYSAQEAITAGIELVENMSEQDPMGPADAEGNLRRWP